MIKSIADLYRALALWVGGVAYPHDVPTRSAGDLMAIAAFFAFSGLLGSLHAYRTASTTDICFAGLWFAGAAIGFVRYRAERRFRQGL